MSEVVEEAGTPPDGMTEAERRAAAEGRKKHSRPILTIEVDGQTVKAEKVWGSCIFPSDVVRDFNQWCRDTGRKPSEVISGLIEQGMTPLFAEVAATKPMRDNARKVKRIANDEETLLKIEAKLAAQQAERDAKLIAVRAKIAEMRAQGDSGAVDPLSAILGTDTGDKGGETEPELVTANGKRKK